MNILDRVAVRDLVASLPEPERALAELLMAGHTQSAAAKQLGITIRSAQYRLWRIRQRLGA